MECYKVCLLVLGMSVVALGQDNNTPYASFTCDLFATDDLSLSMEYGVSTDVLTFRPGQDVHVTLRGSSPIKGFIIQARTPTSVRALGLFRFHPSIETLNCNHDDQDTDTIFRIVDIPEHIFRVTWRAPDTAGTIMDMEFHVVFMDADGNLHRAHSNILSEESVEVDTDEADLHSPKTEEHLAREAQEKEDAAIRAENLASEDDTFQTEYQERLEHEAEMRQEELEMERMMKDEEDARVARIRAEIEDKEEYDSLVMEEEERIREEEERRRLEEEETIIIIEEDDDNTAGAAMMTSSLVSAILALVAVMFL